MRRSFGLLAVIAAIASGCGYKDENPQAASIVAQAYLNALAAHDAHAVCRVLAPEVQAAIARGGTCDQGILASLRHRSPRLAVGKVEKIQGPPGNPRFEVAVRSQPGREIVVGRYGSIWRVVDGGQPQ
jgi:hypothetical protein